MPLNCTQNEMLSSSPAHLMNAMCPYLHADEEGKLCVVKSNHNDMVAGGTEHSSQARQACVAKLPTATFIMGGFGSAVFSL